ncbi:hypothetical protein [Spirosoma sordidisoli]|uniref:Uncharacterized protein n=1 Tax=Spirosoma sordidisoli TaxID=2502893 RepID=A0A4Q2UM02_9BACT|nr:hypothetical protein [Spirosoma sordidisoli]RYC69772.1 hypothetical protein EQG79_14345 [Spirosoma sordidisoli]
MAKKRPRTGFTTTTGFYSHYPSSLLVKILKGLERDFDAAAAGEAYRPPMIWLSARIDLIARILEQRAADQEPVPGRIDSRLAKPIRVTWKTKP